MKKNVLAGVKNFSYSRTLFTNDDGSPLTFYAPASVECADLNDIITKGGGVLNNDARTGETINLCNDSEKDLIQEGYLPVAYIKKCVLRAILIDPDYYSVICLHSWCLQRHRVLGVTSTNAQTSRDDHDEDDDNFDSVMATSIIQVPATSKGRSKYTDQDDFKLLEYIVNHRAFKKVKGNALWKEMAAIQVTGHTSQSMRSRFHKFIMPKLDLYDLPPDWKDKLTGKFKRAWEDDEDSSVEDDTNSVADTIGNSVVNEKTDMKRNKTEKKGFAQKKFVKKSTTIECFHIEDSIIKCIDKDFRSFAMPLNNVPQEQAPRQKKTEENHHSKESLGFQFEEDEDEFQNVATYESVNDTVNYCKDLELETHRNPTNENNVQPDLDLSTDQPSAIPVELETNSSDEDEFQNVATYERVNDTVNYCKDLELETHRNPTNENNVQPDLDLSTDQPSASPVELETNSGDEEEFQSLDEVEESEATHVISESANYCKGLENVVETDRDHRDENNVQIHFDSSMDEPSVSAVCVETVENRDIERKSIRLSNCSIESSPRQHTQRRQVKMSESDSDNVNINHRAKVGLGKLIEKRRKQTKHPVRRPVEVSIQLDPQVREPSTSKDVEIECVSKEVTRQRIKAVMDFYEMGLEKAIDFMEKNQHNLWPII